MIKIIAGKYKGRLIPTLKGADYRPSTGRFKEALFSILASGTLGKEQILENANILDLFAGTGGLSFEALSRGAKTATLVDINENYLKAAKIFAEKIGESNNMNFLKLSATNLPFSGKKYNLILMDPPYGKDFVSKTIKSLITNMWLEDNAIIVVEQPRKEELDLYDLVTPKTRLKDSNSETQKDHLKIGEHKESLKTSLGSFENIDERSYGNSKMSILRYKC